MGRGSICATAGLALAATIRIKPIDDNETNSGPAEAAPAQDKDQQRKNNITALITQRRMPSAD